MSLLRPVSYTHLDVYKRQPKNVKADIEAYSKLSEMPVYTFEGSSVELGSICGKPFTVSVLIIQEPGDSNICLLYTSRCV